MTRKLFIAPLLALGLAAVPAVARAAPAAPAQQEARIPFVNHGGIRDWRSEGDQTIYIQDRGRHWYKATLMGRVFDLPFAETIGFDTGPIDTFDHFSSVIVHGQRFGVQSVVRVPGPPTTAPRRRA